MGTNDEAHKKVEVALIGHCERGISTAIQSRLERLEDAVIIDTTGKGIEEITTELEKLRIENKVILIGKKRATAQISSQQKTEELRERITLSDNKVIPIMLPETRRERRARTRNKK